MPKYTIRAPRYINGQYVHASPEYPAVVELPEGEKADRGLEPFEGETPAPLKLKPHYVEKGVAQPHPQSTPVAGKAKGKGNDSPL